MARKAEKCNHWMGWPHTQPHRKREGTGYWGTTSRLCYNTGKAKARLVKAMVFPVVMDGCESWTAKKAESQRIDAFELWCWRRL